ncbi:MAG: exo-alpha-sialidase [Planctomycetes bacterium]|nr:exo-alpha-sialidase [Planctomycetota bacterium]
MANRLLSVLSLFVAAAVTAQAPPHAVTLNPSAVALLGLRMVRSGETVHAVGITGGAASGFVHYARSQDGGRTWPVREVPIAYLLGLDDVAVSGDHVHVLGHVMFGGPYIISSHDGGATWMPPLLVNGQTTYSSVAALHVDGNVVNVFWTENRSSGRAWPIARSTAASPGRRTTPGSMSACRPRRRCSPITACGWSRTGRC